MPLHQWLNVPATVRASFAAYNTLDDVHRLAEAVEFAQHRLKRK
jgi:selenocysteine lyase/cysteine desulfurase